MILKMRAIECRRLFGSHQSYSRPKHNRPSFSAHTQKIYISLNVLNDFIRVIGTFVPHTLTPSYVQNVDLGPNGWCTEKSTHTEVILCELLNENKT